MCTCSLKCVLRPSTIFCYVPLNVALLLGLVDSEPLYTLCMAWITQNIRFLRVAIYRRYIFGSRLFYLNG
ncbi:hypothetical protein FRC18_010684 [Serendipita sp. 400]|nr:hypothetical protein FRC18_010684 [Serendipita sp. 400]